MFKPSVMIGLIIAIVLVYLGYGNYAQYEKVRQRQLSINEQVDSYKETWLALQTTIGVWKDSFTPASDIRDMVSLYESMKIKSSNLEPATDSIVDGGRKDFGGSIGLTRSCIMNTGSGFAFKPASIATYIQGLESLERRHDIVIGDTVIDASSVKDKGLPTMVVTSLCSLLRADEEF